MRRPAPLPASPEEPTPDDVSEDAAPGRRRGLLRFGGASADAAGSPAQDAGDPDVADAADRASTTDVIEDEDRDAVREAVRSSEVWRAARARRKALRAEIRRFTQRSRRRRFVVWGSAAAIAALVIGSVVAAYSPLFAVEKITVAGATTIDPAVVQQSLSGQIGAPLALVDADEVRSALAEFPVIESYALEVRPPRELLVRIVERTPIGAIRGDDGYSVVDAAGVVLASSPELPEGRPELDVAGGVRSAAFHSAGLVMRSLPADLRSTVAEVRATSGDDVTLRLGDGKTVVWGSEKDSVRKAAVLVRLIAASPGSSTFDVSSPTVPVVR
ncbi:FtsQ-type POTRA domain-containing protein [Microbacterium esteraromaticum]|uniref:FtsQ-type POTRA domain-containing protein n=1 Tax=Microbacterium esteraromaticum TaxID=57043 RepID=A0A7D8AIT6_9MICO|nr:FtsQ-type POTRA domain-containing protein [Microbacterium esteraromaticum]QMU98462.1 FtsQ-type POTRA domain-containing protein [Microbacterium esteraromaticum]